MLDAQDETNVEAGVSMKLQKDLVAASATPLVLSLLKSSDRYGYELIKNIRDLSDGQLEWKEGMLYPLLHRLESKALIESYEKQADTGRTRKYYRLLPDGADYLVEQQAGFAAVTSILQRLSPAALPGTGENNV